jgi:protein-tyrosine kinase
MSLVERALKKLQESRGAAAAVQSRPTSAGTVRPAGDHAIVERHAAVVHDSTPIDPPSRTVVIDREALRAMELLPPANVEERIASQYRQIKRPLVDAAFGRSTNPVPNGQLIMLASALPGEGKTFTSINLALSMALEKDSQVLLVDADIPKPHITRIFGLQGERGLLDLLVDSSARVESFILPTDVPGLSILPAGTQVENATELLASERMQHVVAQLGSTRVRRMVLFDSPPLLLSTESRALVSMIGQTVLVVRAEFTPRHVVQDAIDAIGDEKPISLILNQSEAAPAAGYYGYGAYGDSPARPAG